MFFHGEESDGILTVRSWGSPGVTIWNTGVSRHETGVQRRTIAFGVAAVVPVRFYPRDSSLFQPTTRR